MIIKEQKSNIEVIGDITEFKSSIDPKNLEFITTLLSSNLYSAPERSFIREIVSNAWDSQVEANTTDIPIIIKIEERKETVRVSYGDNYERWSGIGDITIRDFGTGLSPERFNEVYRNIGSSTKRESNAYHGAFGIGHLSGFSCSNTMYITSYYEGTCYEYIGIKDVNTIVYTLVSTTPTTEKNGLEVTLKSVVLSKYRKTLKYIAFFPNVFVKDNCPDLTMISVNETKIKKHKNFWVASIRMEDKLLLGNVLYPLNTDELNFSNCDYKLNEMEVKELLEFINNLKYTGLVFKFDIGELSVTPNRENIIYTKECNNKIIGKIIEVKKEVEDLINEKSKKDFNHLLDYIELIRRDKSFDFFNEKIVPYDYNSYPLPKSKKLNITYKNKDLSLYSQLLYYLTNDLSYCAKCYVGNNVHSNYSSMPLKYRNQCSLYKNNELIILKKDITLGVYLKRYLLENYANRIILNPLNLNEIKNFIKYTIRIDNYSDISTIDFIIQEVIDYIYSKGTVIDFNTDTAFIEYKKQCKEEAKNRKNLNLIDTEEVILYLYRNPYCNSLKTTHRNIKKAIEYLKKEHKGIVLIDRDTSDSIKDVILVRKCLPVFAKKSVREVLKKCSFNVDLDWLLHSDPMLSYIKTIREIFDSESAMKTSLNVISTVISDNYKEDIEKILSLGNLAFNCLYSYYVNNYGKVDEDFKLKLLKIKTCISQYNKAAEILEDSGIQASSYTQIHDKSYIGLITKVLIKQKSFRVNSIAYKHSKYNKLVKILCKK